MNTRADIIIIGAGICGLAIAEALSSNGKRIILLEARDRVGGRIYSFQGNFSEAVEAGAEFMHGRLPLTTSLIEKAGTNYREKKGDFYKSKEGKVQRVEELIPHMRELMKSMKNLKEDTTLTEFLDIYFKGSEYNELRSSVYRIAEGFDAADPRQLSVFALRDEWAGESLQEPYVIEKGYTHLIQHLAERCKTSHVQILLSKPVKRVEWSREKVKVFCQQNVYSALQLIITVPLGILKAKESEENYIEFFPSLSGQLSAAKHIGFGPVIKVVFELKNRFWTTKTFNYEATIIDNAGFIMNESSFPMFWINDSSVPMITGWAGGNAAEKLKHYSNEDLKNLAIKSLSIAMICEENLIREQLRTIEIFNWGIDSYSKGAYSYATPKSEWAKEIVSTPVEDTIFFAGEAFGKSIGTVEAALESAQEIIKKLG